MANNRGQTHIADIQNRTQLQEYTVERIYENDNEEIDAVDVVETVMAIAQSSVNLVDDDVDLRQGKIENFTFSQCVQNGAFYEFTLQHTAVHPDDGSGCLILEGFELRFGTDFTISGNKVSFSPNDDFEPDTQLEVKYKYYETIGN